MAKPAKKKNTSGRKKTPAKKADVDLKGVRQKVKNAIGARAEKMTIAVVDEVLQKAQAQPLKILFDMIGLFPESEEERAAAADDQSLAKTLLDRLGLSDEALEIENEIGSYGVAGEPVQALMAATGDPVK